MIKKIAGASLNIHVAKEKTEKQNSGQKKVSKLTFFIFLLVTSVITDFTVNNGNIVKSIFDLIPKDNQTEFYDEKDLEKKQEEQKNKPVVKEEKVRPYEQVILETPANVEQVWDAEHIRANSPVYAPGF